MVIFMIVTSRGGIIQIGHGYESGGIVKSILPQIGDPSLLIPSGYEVVFDDGKTACVYDAAEVWRKPQ